MLKTTIRSILSKSLTEWCSQTGKSASTFLLLYSIVMVVFAQTLKPGYLWDEETIQLGTLSLLFSIACIWSGLVAIQDAWRRFVGNEVVFPYWVLLPTTGIIALLPGLLGLVFIVKYLWILFAVLFGTGLLAWLVSGVYACFKLVPKTTLTIFVLLAALFGSGVVGDFDVVKLLILLKMVMVANFSLWLLALAGILVVFIGFFIKEFFTHPENPQPSQLTGKNDVSSRSFGNKTPSSKEKYSVVLLDNWHHAQPDHEWEISGFPNRELAVEYARRVVRNSVEQYRKPGVTEAEIIKEWSLGGDNAAVPGGYFYGADHVAFFAKNPATPEECDWKAIEAMLPKPDKVKTGFYSVKVFEEVYPADMQHHWTIQGFPTLELAKEFARRWLRDFVEKQRHRLPGHIDLHGQVMASGRDALVIDEGFRATSELGHFIKNTASPEERDWISIQNEAGVDPRHREKTMHPILLRTGQDLTRGFHIEEPDVMVLWETPENSLQEMLGPHGLSKVTNGYYILPCISLGGMQHILGFHFDDEGTTINHFEFFREGWSDIAVSFMDFQIRFQEAFLKPTKTEKGSDIFPHHKWEWRSCSIKHYVFDRFGLEEHMKIYRNYPHHELLRLPDPLLTKPSTQIPGEPLPWLVRVVKSTDGKSLKEAVDGVTDELYCVNTQRVAFQVETESEYWLNVHEDLEKGECVMHRHGPKRCSIEIPPGAKFLVGNVHGWEWDSTLEFRMKVTNLESGSALSLSFDLHLGERMPVDFFGDWKQAFLEIPRSVHVAHKIDTA
ncbi:MAG: hypothetical protein HQL69_17495 [Magnetococcales bacterium]|nr:hypothetical protein [Magnetococcales bacterium]